MGWQSNGSLKEIHMQVLPRQIPIQVSAILFRVPRAYIEIKTEFQDFSRTFLFFKYSNSHKIDTFTNWKR